MEELLKSDDLAKGRHTAEPKAGPMTLELEPEPEPHFRKARAWLEDPARSEAQKTERPYRTDGRKLNENLRKNLKQSPKNDEYEIVKNIQHTHREVAK